MSKEAMNLALAALGLVEGDIEWQERSMTRKVVLKAITALREALAEQPAQQEPVAIVDGDDHGYFAEILPDRNVKIGQLLYASAPAQRTWVGLTEQEAAECWSTSTVRTWQAIEAKLKEKNT